MNETARILALPTVESRPKFGPGDLLAQRLREIRAIALGAVDDAEIHGDYTGVNRKMYSLAVLAEEALELHKCSAHGQSAQQLVSNRSAGDGGAACQLRGNGGGQS